MTAPRQILLVYASLLFATSMAVLGYLLYQNPVTIESPFALIAFTVFTVFIISAGFSGPYFGHTSLDRVAQVASVLIFGTLLAACVNAVASLVWPFIDRKHNVGSFGKTIARALHGSGMFAAMILISGSVYDLVGGELPLTELNTQNIIAITLMVLTMQITNESLMAVFAQINQGDFRKWFSLFSSVVEIGAAPLGVFTALVFNLAEPEVFGLFAGLLVILVLIFKRFAENHWELAARVDELLAINRIGRAISSSLILDDLVELIYQECRKLVNFSAFYLILYDEDKRKLDFRLHHNEQGRQPRKIKELGEGALSWIIQNNEPMLIEDWTTSDHVAKSQAVIVGETPMSVIGVPVSFGNRVLGAISLQNFVANTFDKDDLNLMMTFADQVAVAIANARLFEEIDAYKLQLEEKVEERTHELNKQKEELFQLSQSLKFANRQKEQLLDELKQKTEELDRQTKEDSLTGLFNRRYMEARLATEIRRAERFNRPISVAMLDIDDFKRTNDEFSHMLADEVLRIVADLLKKQCRAIDVISRYGGDEFVLCFPETDLESSVIVCEKIRKAVEQYPWVGLDSALKVTISIGVAGATPDYQQDKLLIAADAKLYEAKRAGRNLVRH
ncbi:MAG: diguanylate cyclase [Gammaproteobacteria bacterium]|nr:diguanylate cyclase [Gammaproteobacteria bacterium]